MFVSWREVGAFMVATANRPTPLPAAVDLTGGPGTPLLRHRHATHALRGPTGRRRRARRVDDLEHVARLRDTDPRRRARPHGLEKRGELALVARRNVRRRALDRSV